MKILQTQSPNKSIRDWGCNFYSLLDFLGYEFTSEQALEIFETCVKLGYILDNDVPISKTTKWYRCFVVNPELVLHFASRYIGRTENFSYVIRIKEPFPIDWFNTNKGKFMLEFQTAIGSHFLTGQISVINQTKTVTRKYNPDPTVPLLKLSSIRLFMEN